MLKEKMATWRAIRARFGDLTMQRHDRFEGNKARSEVLILAMESIAIISFRRKFLFSPF
jgi:hypothetical protein